MTSFFRFVNKRAIYQFGIISFAHVAVNVTDFPVVNVPVDELSSARIWQHKLAKEGRHDIILGNILLCVVYLLKIHCVTCQSGKTWN
jgi:hypothetical protein